MELAQLNVYFYFIVYRWVFFFFGLVGVSSALTGHLKRGCFLSCLVFVAVVSCAHSLLPWLCAQGSNLVVTLHLGNTPGAAQGPYRCQVWSLGWPHAMQSPTCSVPLENKIALHVEDFMFLDWTVVGQHVECLPCILLT